jgi:hypothetical protein
MKWSLLILALVTVSCNELATVDESPEEWAGYYCFTEIVPYQSSPSILPTPKAHHKLYLLSDGDALHASTNAYGGNPRGIMIGQWTYKNNIVLFHFRDQKIKFAGSELDLKRENGRVYKHIQISEERLKKHFVDFSSK